MNMFRFPLVATLLLAFVSVGFAQAPPQLTDQHKELQKDVGVWDGEMKMYMAPGQDPQVMPIVETNKVLPGGLWIHSEFDAGPFQGRGYFGYDSHKNQYVGNWVDNMNAHMSVMKGKMNDKGELVMLAKNVNPENGKEYNVKSVSKYTDDNTKEFNMYREGDDGEWIKMFDITYKRRNADT